jgi:hypothetical protein
MTEPTAPELVDLNALPSPNSRPAARAKSASISNVSPAAGITHSLGGL